MLMEVENQDDGVVGEEVNVISLKQPKRGWGNHFAVCAQGRAPFGDDAGLQATFAPPHFCCKAPTNGILVWGKVAAYLMTGIRLDSR